MLSLPFFIFWALIILARHELTLKAIAIFILIWTALLACSINLDLSPYPFIIAQTLLDITLILLIFGSDIKIR